MLLGELQKGLDDIPRMNFAETTRARNNVHFQGSTSYQDAIKLDLPAPVDVYYRKASDDSRSSRHDSRGESHVYGSGQKQRMTSQHSGGSR